MPQTIDRPSAAFRLAAACFTTLTLAAGSFAILHSLPTLARADGPCVQGAKWSVSPEADGATAQLSACKMPATYIRVACAKGQETVALTLALPIPGMAEGMSLPLTLTVDDTPHTLPAISITDAGSGHIVPVAQVTGRTGVLLALSSGRAAMASYAGRDVRLHTVGARTALTSMARTCRL